MSASAARIDPIDSAGEQEPVLRLVSQEVDGEKEPRIPKGAVDPLVKVDASDSPPPDDAVEKPRQEPILVLAKIGRNKEVDILRKYLDEIGEYELLTKEDELRLYRAMEEGKEAARELSEEKVSRSRKSALRAAVIKGETAEREFSESNLRLVVSIAKKYQGRGVPLLDLIQEGNLGLMHAVELFDGERGFKFSTYATWWVRKYVKKGVINNSGTIHIPAGTRNRIGLVADAIDKLSMENGERPGVAELVNYLALSFELVEEALAYAQEPLSLDASIGEEGTDRLGDFVHDQTVILPDEEVVERMFPERVKEIMSCLSQVEANVIYLRFGFDVGYYRTVAEVVEILEMNYTYVVAVQARALKKLREAADMMAVSYD